MVTDLVIPALDERANVDALFDALDAEASRLRRIVLADNGSTDATAAVARDGVAVSAFGVCTDHEAGDV